MNNIKYYQKQSEFNAVYFLIAINVVVFVINNLLLGSTTPLTEYGVLNNFYIRQGEIWRVVTSMFLHGSIMHLLMNMWGLWLFGQALEQAIGSRRFLILYFIAGIGGALLWGLISPWNMVNYGLDNGDGTMMVYKISYLHFVSEVYPHVQDKLILLNSCLGASGAVTGVVLGMALISPQTKIQLLFPPIPMTLKTFALVYIVAEVFLSGSGDNVAHSVHVGGGIFGFGYLLFECFREPSLFFVRDRIKLWWYRVSRKFKSTNQSHDSHSDTSSQDPVIVGHIYRQNVLEILLKMDREGIDSLTSDELEVLKQAKKIIRKDN